MTCVCMTCLYDMYVCMICVCACVLPRYTLGSRPNLVKLANGSFVEESLIRMEDPACFSTIQVGCRVDGVGCAGLV